MESPTASPLVDSVSGQSSRSRSSTKLNDDIASLTSFNPFSEEDEHDQSSYTLVTSILSRVKNSLSAPLTSAAATTTNATTSNNNANTVTNTAEARRPTYATIQTNSSNFSSRTSASDRPNPLVAAPAQAAPPLVSLTPAQSELPTYTVEYDRSTAPKTPYSPGIDLADNAPFGTSIPGFPIQDDARSIKTTTSIHNRSGSVSKVMRRLRGEGLSRDYWMDDENCKECYDCKSIFTTWRRKHHCRICGQIFCSRCASNIIKGARFGSEGMVRVCNLCLEKLAKVEEDDDDDRRSVISSATTFPAHQMGIESFTSLPHPQSPFSASHLFANEPFNLFSIAETRKPLYGSDGSFSRPETPLMREGEDGVWESVRDNPAPFRRALSDEEKEHQESPPASLPVDHTVPNGKIKKQLGIDFPASKPIDIDASQSSIQFPIGSPEQLGTPRLQLKSRTTSSHPYGEFDVATPFIRSRVQSRLEPQTLEVEPGWRMRRESTAYAQELNLASMHHLKIMLRQMLTSEQIPNIREWEETLLRLALRIAREMTFTSLPHRQGQDMDVRRYVKIKKIPGGKPRDSEYVTGAVITKNVAHKRMSRLQANPRVMLVTFPLEFSRVEGQYMHFGQIVRQEKEYLGNLASRIAALRPHVVLVEKSVSRLALDALAQHNIAVARTVKSSAIQTIARMTQGDVFSSMDKLALEPRLGHCARYCIQTYDHPLIPGHRKTYMRFEGCNRDMGCTIILRGGNIDTLRRIKKVTRFLTFVVRNLKLETHLWKDSVISLPSDNAFAIPLSESRQLQLDVSMNSLPSANFSAPKLLISSTEPEKKDGVVSPPIDGTEEDLPNEDAEQLRLTRRIDDSLEPYTKTFISISSTLRFPPPYPIRRMKELDNKLLEAKRAWEDEIVRKEERFQSMHRHEETLTALTPTGNGLLTSNIEECEDIFAQIEALPVLNIPSTPLNADGFPTASLADQDSYFSLPTSSPSPSKPTTPALSAVSSSFLTPEEPECLKTVADIHHQSYYTFLKWQHEEFRRIWEWYLRKNADDFVIEKYQCIHVREYTVSSADVNLHRPCFAPRITYIKFYGENDMTLGQFIEKSVNETLMQYQDPKAICTGKGCEQPLARHCKVYVHNETSLSVAVEQWDGQIIGYPSYDLVTTWSACRVCGSATPFIPVSEEMMRYSFAKFLELHFYPADVLLVHGAGCQHNIYQHHVRFFATKGMTVRFQADPVVLQEIVYPPFRIRVRPETQLELKNADFERLHYRNMLWYTGLIDDLKLISIDAATGDEETDARLLADINALITRAESEREDISRSINETYRNTPPTDTLALNQIHAYRQDKIVAWQMDFDRLPKPRPVQNSINRNSNRSSAFDSIRSMWPRRYDLANAFDSPHLPSSSVSEAEEVPYKSRRIAASSSAFASSASDTESSADNNERGEKLFLNSNLQENTEGVSENEVHEDLPKSDPDSDSTIGAPREEVANAETTNIIKDDGKFEPTIDELISRPSRVPRRLNSNMSVADLVKKYQDFLPAQGIHELTRTAFPPKPAMSESEQEYPSQLTLRQPIRSKSRHRIPVRKASTSDFEQGYAANVAPKYLTHSRRSPAVTNGSRIPAPKGSNLESQSSSRRHSPEKRSFSAHGKEVRFSRPSSPSGKQPVPPGPKQPKPRIVSRTKDKPPPRPSSSSATKSTFRRLPSGTGNKVSNIAKHFERLGRDAERSKSRYAVIRGKRARPVASARAKVEVLNSVKDAIRDDSESSDSSSEADDEDEGNDEDQPATATSAQTLPEKNEELPTEPVTKVIPTIDLASTEHLPIGQEEPTTSLPPPGQISVPSSPFLSATIRNKQDTTLTPPPSDLELTGGTERNSILKALSGFWPQPVRHSVEGDDPMSDPEHIFRDSSMVVRLDEPTSIIALALNSPQYRDLLAKSRAEKKTAREAKISEGSEAFMPDDGSVGDSSSTWGVVNVDSDSADPTEDLRAPSSKLPWAISFESGGLTISCTVLYPEQFDALRRTYDCEKSMVESLSRCVKWNASGGKSGSAFLKTRDDRFIAKELSKPELQTMETFAPAYFDYMSSSVHADRPTLLAKVFGCYKLTFRKTGKDKGPGKSKSMQMNLLVMENLFYDRRFTKIYDLKGSTRNRHVQSTGRENEVLLDENLVETSHLNPFYLREHSKRILRGALYNDSKFLSDINVMDYSLVCGVDSQNNELVIGIVDYIRTYTWDKKLESWVKESAFLGGAGRGEPTIVTPKQYRQRFISAMERYFPLIPDRWMKQRDTPEEESSIILSELWPDW
ncbi:1-phosphatidylinositol 3-phosphate 5-kinase FAB1 [Psilocybe cubensis]|uniref:1-phosphatidylinositol 3-phosphate 5-kinase FAB1 n=2 Tax=Psilocybe cubensis TaxID=181762 RepID=A0ACB8HEA9_PSICU|nr:1-phosphatidylinositol 3-phosphate 5-kinase FAB1 [Psilocybe cubensis]KAH9486348.1 1-phosphatidylinositol 3-phosphate 5-kinase FAB1 [Psilocybe cubensis]